MTHVYEHFKQILYKWSNSHDRDGHAQYGKNIEKTSLQPIPMILKLGFGYKLYRQDVGIRTGTNCAPCCRTVSILQKENGMT